MANPPKIVRFKTEDFPAEFREIADQLSGVLNDFIDETVSNLSGRIDFQNLNRQLLEITISTDSLGIVINPPDVKITLKSKIAGINCIKADNLLSPTIYPTSHPFISFGIKSNTLINITNISGLQANSQYRLKLEIIGS